MIAKPRREAGGLVITGPSCSNAREAKDMDDAINGGGREELRMELASQETESSWSFAPRAIWPTQTGWGWSLRAGNNK
jgi:hypothetical protein